jgi:hypothetical protein
MIPTRKQELEAKIAAGEIVKPRLLRSRSAIATSLNKLSPAQLELVKHDLIDWIEPEAPELPHPSLSK